MNETNVLEKNYTYKLENLLEYSHEGQFEKTGEISFSPPGMDILDETTDLDQLVMGAFMSAGKRSQGGSESESDEKEEAGPQKAPTPKEIKAVLFSCDVKDVKVTDIVKSFKTVAFLSGKLDDSGQKLNKDLISKMSKNDFVSMMCGYISFFTFPSLLSEG